MSMGLFLLSLRGSGLHPFTAALFNLERMERNNKWIVLQ